MAIRKQKKAPAPPGRLKTMREPRPRTEITFGGFKLVSNEKTWVVHTGKGATRTFNTLGEALERLLEEKLRKVEARKIEELLDEVRTMQQEMIALSLTVVTGSEGPVPRRKR